MPPLDPPNNRSTTFTLLGTEVTLTAAQVRSAAKKMESGVRNQHIVEVDGKPYPATRLFALALNIDLSDARTSTARLKLMRLGFHVYRAQP